MAEQTISITINDERKEVDASLTGTELFAENKDIIAVRLNGEPPRPVHAAARRRRGRADHPRQRGWPGHHAPLGHACHGPGGPGDPPGRQARHRSGHQERLLLRLRRQGSVHPGGSQGDREAHAADHQVRAVVPPPRGHRGGGPRRGGRPAVQARTDRRQGGRARSRGRHRGKPGRTEHVRQRGPRGQHRLEGPVPRPAPAEHPLHQGLQAGARGRRLLARLREEPDAANASTAPHGPARTT